MDASIKKRIDFHLDILPRQTKKAFAFLSEQGWLSGGGWYLAGGTALTLHAGHRSSVDLDFFTMEKDFDNLELLDIFLRNSEWETVIDKKIPFMASYSEQKLVSLPILFLSQNKILFSMAQLKFFTLSILPS